MRILWGYNEDQKTEMEPIENIIKEIIDKNQDEKKISKFIADLKSFVSFNSILPSDIRNIAYELDVRFNCEKLWDVLLGKSLSLTKISSEILNSEFLNQLNQARGRSVEEIKTENVRENFNLKPKF